MNMLITQSLCYESEGKKLIDRISLEFHPSHIYGIIGPNGSGKTTLLKVLTGLWKASSGKVLWNNEDLFSLDRREISQILSLVPQNAQVHFDFTVSEVVEMGTYPRKNLTRAERDRLIRWALEWVDAWHLRDQWATKISHGERQRMYIARSLVTQSPVLILDEPTSNLDIRHQLGIWNMLKRLKSENKIIIVANHDLQSTRRYCDRVIVLDQGKCAAEGPYSNIMSPSLISRIFGIKTLTDQQDFLPNTDLDNESERLMNHASVIS